MYKTQARLFHEADARAAPWGEPGSLNERAEDVALRRALFAMALPANLACRSTLDATGTARACLAGRTDAHRARAATPRRVPKGHRHVCTRAPGAPPGGGGYRADVELIWMVHPPGGPRHGPAEQPRA